LTGRNTSILQAWHCLPLELGRSTAEERPHVPAEEFVEAAAGLLGVAPELLTSRSRNRKAARARRMAVLLAVERWDYRGRDLAQALGRTPDVVSWMVGRAVKDRLEDPGLQQALDDLDRGLIRSLSRTL
jgi:chromosomal replication initiation ATPase DnaA